MVKPYFRKLYVSSTFQQIKEMATIAAAPVLDLINAKNKGKEKVEVLKQGRKKKKKKRKKKKKGRNNWRN